LRYHAWTGKICLSDTDRKTKKDQGLKAGSSKFLNDSVPFTTENRKTLSSSYKTTGNKCRCLVSNSGSRNATPSNELEEAEPLLDTKKDLYFLAATFFAAAFFFGAFLTGEAATLSAAGSATAAGALTGDATFLGRPAFLGDEAFGDFFAGAADFDPVFFTFFAGDAALAFAGEAGAAATGSTAAAASTGAATTFLGRPAFLAAAFGFFVTDFGFGEAAFLDTFFGEVFSGAAAATGASTGTGATGSTFLATLGAAFFADLVGAFFTALASTGAGTSLGAAGFGISFPILTIKNPSVKKRWI